MHARNHRPKGWYGENDPGGSDPLGWLTRELVARGSYESVVRSIPNLDAYYRLDEETGDFHPSIGRMVDEGRDGKLVATGNYTTTIPLVRGVAPIGPLDHNGVKFDYRQPAPLIQNAPDTGGQHLEYEGDLRVESDFSTFPAYQGEPWSIAMWIRPEGGLRTTAGWGGLYDKSRSFASSVWQQFIRARWGSLATPGDQGRPWWQYGEGTSTQEIAPTDASIKDDEANHIVVTHDPSSFHTELWVNGSLQGTSSLTPLWMYHGWFRLGLSIIPAGTTQWGWFHGSMSGVAFWNGVITPTDIARLVAVSFPAARSSYWTVTDAAPSGGQLGDWHLNRLTGEVFAKIEDPTPGWVRMGYLVPDGGDDGDVLTWTSGGPAWVAP
jgi:hypothetical protein